MIAGYLELVRDRELRGAVETATLERLPGIPEDARLLLQEDAVADMVGNHSARERDRGIGEESRCRRRRGRQADSGGDALVDGARVDVARQPRRPHEPAPVAENHTQIGEWILCTSELVEARRGRLDGLNLGEDRGRVDAVIEHDLLIARTLCVELTVDQHGVPGDDRVRCGGDRQTMIVMWRGNGRRRYCGDSEHGDD